MNEDVLWTDDDCHAAIRAIAHKDLPDMRTWSVTEFQAEQLMFSVRQRYETERRYLFRELAAKNKRIAALEAELADTEMQLARADLIIMRYDDE